MPNVRLDVGQSIPAGYVVGRLTGGVGDAGLISIASLAGHLVSSGIVSAPGSGGGAATVVAAGTGIGVSVSGSTYTVSNTGVLSNVAGTGISVSGATGNVTVTNTGVTSAVAGTGISVSGATGAVTISTAPLTSLTVTGANGNSVSLSEINGPNFNFNETMKSYGPGANQTSVIELARARGTSASPTAVQSGDILGALDFDGYGATGFFTGGNVQGVATQTWTDTAHGTKLQFGTTGNGAASPTSGYMTLDQDGGLVLTGATGGSQGAGKLNATGLFINGVAVSAGSLGTSPVQKNAWVNTSAYSIENYVSYNGAEYVNSSALGAKTLGTSWNPSQTDAAITLTNSNLSASKGGTSAWRSTVALDGYVNTGKYYFEITCVQLSGSGQLFGIANSTMSTGNGLGLTAGGGANQSLGFQWQRSFFYNAASTATAWKGCVAGDVVGIAVDLANKLIWITNTTSDAGIWNNGTAGTQNPGTGAGGIAINATIIDGTHNVFPAWSGFNDTGGPDKCVFNSGSSAFNGTVPSGFSSWGGTLFGNTTPDVDTSHWIETGVLTFAGLSGIVSPVNGGTGIANNVASTLTISGAFATTLTVSAATNSTLPSGTHTLAGLDVAQTWSAVQTHNSGTLKLAGATSGTITVNAAAIAGTNTITLPAGTTDFSATGGTSQVVKQTSSGAAFTVSALTSNDLIAGSVPTSTRLVKLGATTAAATASNVGDDGTRITYNGQNYQASTQAGGAANTTSNVQTMAGYGFLFTPETSGRIEVDIRFGAESNTTLDGLTAQLRFGTGTAPVNGAAATGTTIGQGNSVTSTTANVLLPISLAGIVTGLTTGTQYWFDIGINRFASGTSTAANATIIIKELP